MCSEPGQSVIGSRIIFDIRKVTPPDEELNTILRHPSVLYYINKVFLVSAFLKEVLAGARALRLLTHRHSDFTPACWVDLAFLPASPPRTLPFTLFVGFAGITTVSQSAFGVYSPRVLGKKESRPDMKTIT